MVDVRTKEIAEGRGQGLNQQGANLRLEDLDELASKQLHALGNLVQAPG